MRHMKGNENIREYRYVFGTHVRDVRKERQLTQEELGRITGLDRTAICRIERGKCSASFDTIMLIASGLSMTPADLFVGIGPLAIGDESTPLWL